MKDEEEVLYEFSTLQKWKATVLTPNPLRYSNLPIQQQFPKNVISRIENSTLWKIAVSPQLHIFALLLQGGDLEIHILESNSELIAKSKVLSDLNPDWCQLEWTQSNNLLVLSRSNAILDIFESNGSYCYSIPLEGSMTIDFNPLIAVCAMASSHRSNETKWSDKLLIMQYNGTLRSYMLGRLSGYHPLSRFNISSEIPSCLFSTLCLLPDRNLILVCGDYEIDNQTTTKDDDCIIAGKLGISLWRPADSDATYLKVPNTNLDQKPRTSVSFLNWLPFFSQQKASVVCMCANKNETHVACVTSVGDLAIFQLPSMRKILFVPNHLLKSSDEAVDKSRVPIHVRWWSEDELIVLRVDGSLNICKANEGLVDVLVKKIEPREKFCYWSSLLASTNGLCHIFEAFAGEKEEKFESGSKVWLAIRMASVWVYGWLKLGVGAAFGNPASEVSLPSPESVATKDVEFRLHELRMTTAEEMFRKKLDLQSYQEALVLAKSYNFNTDMVYQHEWEKSQITDVTIKNCLSNIKNKQWVLNECLIRVPDTDEVTESLLQFGLTLTQINKDWDFQNLTDDQQQGMNWALKLGHYLDVLNDYQALLALESNKGKPFDRIYYQQLRNKSFLEIACHLAQSCQFDSLEVFLLRHTTVLYPHWLVIMTQIPEIVQTSEYGFLLPNLQNGSVKTPWEECDEELMDFADLFLSDGARLAFVAQITQYRTGTNVYDRYPHLEEFRLILSETKTSLSIPVVVHWYSTRAREIEERTTLPELFAEFLQTALDAGFSDLTDLRDEANIYSRLVFETGNSSRTFAQYQEFNVHAICVELMRDVPPELRINRIETLVIPYILHSARFGRCDAKKMFASFLLSQSKENLTAPRQLLDKWKRRSEMRKKLALTNGDLIGLVDDCLTGCQLTGDKLIFSAAKIIHCLPSKENISDETVNTRNSLDQMSGYLEALTTLGYYTVSPTFADLKEAISNEQKSAEMIKLLIHKMKPEEWTITDWQRLYSDACSLTRRIFTKLDVTVVQEMFVDALLASADFAYAAQFMQVKPGTSGTDVSFDNSVTLVLKASEQYVNGATDSKDARIQYAKLCLDLITDPKPDKILAEIDIITSLPAMEELGLKELPVKVRVSDKLHLIERILDVPSYNNYRKLKQLLSLSKLLRIGSGEKERKCLVLVLCAKKAMQVKDGSCAGDYCSELAGLRYTEGWEICRDVALSGLVSKVDVVLDLLNFASLNCDQSELEQLLNYQRKRKMAAICTTVFKEKQPDLRKIAKGLMSQVMNDTKKDRTVPIDPIYCQPDQYTPETELAASANLRYGSASLLRVLCIGNQEIDSSDQTVMWEEAMKVATMLSLHESATWAFAHLLALNNVNWAKSCLLNKSNGQSLLLYYYALMAVTPFEWENVEKVRPDDLVDFVLRHKKELDDQMVQRILWTLNIEQRNRQEDTISKIFPEVDVERFASDPDYREDSILGMAESLKDDHYSAALELAKEHSVSIWDVTMANLNSLLTDYKLSASDAQAVIKRRKLLETLSDDPDKLYQELHRSVLPLLDGCDHLKLQLYFLVVEKGCAGLPEAVEAQMHRSVLRHLAKLIPKINYVGLIGTQSNLFDVIGIHLNSRNVNAVSKVLEKVPNKTLTIGTVMAVWGRKLFQERIIETGYAAAFRAAEPSLAVVNEVDFMEFVNGSLSVVTDQNDTQRLLAILVQYVNENIERLGGCMVELKKRMIKKEEDDSPDSKSDVSSRTSFSSASGTSSYTTTSTIASKTETNSKSPSSSSSSTGSPRTDGAQSTYTDFDTGSSGLVRRRR